MLSLDRSSRQFGEANVHVDVTLEPRPLHELGVQACRPALCPEMSLPDLRQFEDRFV